ncbi:MAG: DUF4430 domain-containing protein [Bacteroidetes bacterium]|nr:DUF4430 domain-containing protein [Bacteroidota bacterium]
MQKLSTPLTLFFTLTVMIGFGCSGGSDQKTNTPPIDSAAVAAAPSDSIVITIVASDTVDAFSVLQESHSVKSKATALGVFVQAIDSIESGGGAYWVFSVNDSLPMVAADKYQVVPGDTVRWHLRYSSR